MDAAVAVQATLGLVEPQSSGPGRRRLPDCYDPQTRKVTSYDGRETAPAGATRDIFLRADGKPMSYPEAVLSGRSAGVPGAIAMLYLAHKDHGKLPWSSLFDDTEKLATDGFLVGPRLVGELHGRRAADQGPRRDRLFQGPDDGTPVKAGDHLKNPAYAATLRLIAAQGPDALLKGKIAADIVAKLAEGPLPGTMT